MKNLFKRGEKRTLQTNFACTAVNVFKKGVNMETLNISPDFTLEDIRTIRDYNYERRKNMTTEERIKDISSRRKQSTRGNRANTRENTCEKRLTKPRPRDTI